MTTTTDVRSVSVVAPNISSRLSALTESHNYVSSVASEAFASSMRVERPSCVRTGRNSDLFTSWIWNSQKKAQTFIDHRFVQLGVAMLIAGNFLTNIVESTIDPQQKTHSVNFWYAESFFTIAFSVELAINMFANWFRPFWRSGWNVFDVIVVAIGLLILCDIDLGPLQILRMLRAFRVFRLFKKVRSFNKIIHSLLKAIPGVVNAFGILLLIMSIYAVLAVEFFSKPEGSGIETGRGLDHADEYFGNFPKALYTMFQILTGESWSEAVVRPVLQEPDGLKTLGAAFFFVSFIMVAQVILINVVIAVLLEKMVDESEIEHRETVRQHQLVSFHENLESISSYRVEDMTSGSLSYPGENSGLSNITHSYPPLSDICGMMPKGSTSSLSDFDSHGGRFGRGSSAASLTSFASSFPDPAVVHEGSRANSPRSHFVVGGATGDRSPTFPPGSNGSNVSNAEVMRNVHALQRDVHDLKVSMKLLINHIVDVGPFPGGEVAAVGNARKLHHRLRRRSQASDGAVMGPSRSAEFLGDRPNGLLQPQLSTFTLGSSAPDPAPFEDHVQVAARSSPDGAAPRLERLASAPARTEHVPAASGAQQAMEPRPTQDSNQHGIDAIIPAVLLEVQVAHV